MNATPALGFAHFLAQTDAVARALLVILLAMSVLSWTLIALSGVRSVLARRRSRRLLDSFEQAASIDEVGNEIATNAARDPFSHLALQALRAHEHHARCGGASLAEAGTAQDFVTRSIKKVLDEENLRLERGLTALATIGATAPFVGLFGTVWGVYRALVAIGMSGAGTLDKVAGPVGEALIMTGIGLAVAIPAVVGFNAISRGNRVLNAKLDAFAYELVTLLSMGPEPQPTRADSPSRPRAVRPAAAG